MLDTAVKALGFDSADEFHRMAAGADISTPEKLAAFKAWQENDGTKVGLQRLAAGVDVPGEVPRG